MWGGWDGGERKDVLAASGKSLIVGGTDCAARIGEFEGVGG